MPMYKMKAYAKAIAGVVFFSFAASAFAGGWQQPTKVSRYMIEGSPAGERIYVQFESDFNPDACKGKDTAWKRIYGDTEKGKYLLSAILSAKAAGQTVVPLLHGCDDWGRPGLIGLIVQ